MLATATLPPEFEDWNRRHQAPFGSPLRKLFPKSVRGYPVIANLCGRFAFQPNNSIRRYEYPWAYQMLGPAPGLRVVEIGGGYSGFQFVLDRAGCRVTNVDPGAAARGKGWGIRGDFHQVLNRRFGADVVLKPTFLQEAELPSESFDRALSISTLEHVPDADIGEILAHIRRILVPGGRCVLTVDLFLDVEPFAAVETNRWGRNVSVRSLVERSGMKLLEGDEAELYGYPSFSVDRIRDNLDKYMVGHGHPALAQLLVLEKV